MHRIEYDAGSARLDIWFNGTGRYTYYGVPAHIYAGLLAAGSRGRYFNDNIRDRYG
ncbi:KTSC domain-containing protein [Allosphingosinicella sp.]|uniref:KTSC domain-containing protein n=1 Tax=Allosphingosinicella sp. TaxID=2823234 RepID=UPI003D7350F9